MTRQNRIAERTTVTLGGHERSLRYDLEALRLLEEELGLDLLNDPGALTRVSLKDVAVIIWAGVTHDDDALYAEGLPGEARQQAITQVRRMVDVRQIPAVMEAMYAALNASMPEPDEDAGELDPNASRPSPSPGSASGPVDGATLGSVKPSSGRSPRVSSTRSSSAAKNETDATMAASR